MYYAGMFSFFTVFYAFVFLPLLEMLLPASDKNLAAAEEDLEKKNPVYDYMLYMNVPVQFGLLYYFVQLISTQTYTTAEYAGITLSMGICCGTLGINVAHELGHRVNGFERFLAKSLLLTSLYMHFYIEHNKGHHKNVATDADPASATLGETIYAFWLRSVLYSIVSAWRIERKELQKQGVKTFSLQNSLLQFVIIEVFFLVIIAFVFSVKAMLFFIAAAAIGMLLLETINYIEHYGLRRKKLASGNYERVMPWHSWNSNHYLGRICLYELTRHSDHHFLASRKYQLLRHMDDAPQLPAGYPAMMLLSLVPPVWFKVMNRRAEHVMQTH
jgi:alkane 1-monooxygenase